MPAKRSERLSSVDTAWLRMEDPTNLMMVTGVLVFDQPLNFARLRQTIEQRLLSFDRFHQQVVDADGTPHWQDRPTFHDQRAPAPDRAAGPARPGRAAGTGQHAHEHAARSHQIALAVSPDRTVWRGLCGADAAASLHRRWHRADGRAALADRRDGRAACPPPIPLRRAMAAARCAGPIAAANATVRAAEKLLDQGIETLLEPARLAEAAQFGASSAVALSRLLLMSPSHTRF